MPDPRSVSLNHRLRNAAVGEGLAIERLRNRVAFQRILARLARHDGWVLKGGFCLEIRLGLAARATKDLDLLRPASEPMTAIELQDLLDEALDVDLGDDFAFGVRAPRAVRVEDQEPSTWRLVVDAAAFGEPFCAVVIDVVTIRTPFVAEPLTVAATVVGETFVMPAVDLERHAAEKFHAYARIYAHDRPSSRVKDLVDLALLAEAALLDPARLRVRLGEVFAERDAAEPPPTLPDPPREWGPTFSALASECGLAITTSDEAFTLALTCYTTALTDQETR